MPYLFQLNFGVEWTPFSYQYINAKCILHSNVFGMTPDIQVNAVSNATHMIVSRGSGGGQLEVQVIQLVPRP